MQAHGLRAGAICLDVGAGTGLMLASLSAAVGEGGRVVAIDISRAFCAFLSRRVPRERLANVTVQRCTAKSTAVAAGSGEHS